jgi:hypothetical protein
MVSSAINVRTCVADELYKLYSVREKISLSSIFDTNAPLQALEIAYEESSMAMGSDQLLVGYHREDR